MNLLQDSQLESSVYICSFQCTIKQANIAMKFPCSYFVQWSTSNKKSTATSAKHHPQQSVVQFEQKIILHTEMVYNSKKNQYSKKETLVQLYLVSKSRPDQNKLVGRVSIDLAKVINFQMYAEPTVFKLSFCSVQATITLQFHVLSQKLTAMKMNQLDKSSVIDYISQIVLKSPKNSSLNKSKEHIQQVKESISIGKQILQLKKSLQINSQAAQASLARNGMNNTKVLNSGNMLLGDQFGYSSAKHEIQRISDQILTPDEKIMKFKIGQNLNHQTRKRDYIKDQAIIQSQHTDQPGNQNESSLPQPIQVSKVQKIQQDTGQYRDDKDQALQLIESIHQIQNIQVRLNTLQEINSKQVQYSKQARLSPQNRVSDIQQKEKSLQEVNMQLKSQIYAQNTTIKALEEQLYQKTNLCQKLQIMVRSEAQQQLNGEAFQQYQTQLIYLREKASRYQSQITSLNQLLNQAESKERAYQQRVGDLDRILKGLELQNDKYKNQLQEEHSLRKELESKIVYIQAQVAQFDELKKMLQSRLKESWDQINKQTSEKQKVLIQKETVIQDLYNKNRGFQQLIFQLKQANEKLEYQLQQFLAQYQNLQAQNMKYKVTLQQAKFQMQQQIQLLVISNNERIAELSQQYKKSREENYLLKQSFVKLEKETGLQIYSLKNENTALRNHIQTFEHQLTKLHYDIRQRQSFEMEKEARFEESIGNLRSQITELTRELVQSKKQLLAKKQQNNEIILKLQNLQNQKLALTQKLQLYSTKNINASQVASQSNKESNIVDRPKSEQNMDQKILQFQTRISKLNSNLEEQINQNNQLSQTILNYMEKQAKMKETLNILEQESKEIFVLFQEKEHNEETYQRMIQDLQKEIKRLSVNFYQIHRQQPNSTKALQNSPASLKRLKQSWQHSNDELTKTNKQLQQLNQQLNEEMLKLKLMYNNLKQQSEIQIIKLNQKIMAAYNATEKDEYSQKVVELEKIVRAKDLEAQIMSSKLKQAQQAKSKVQIQLGQVKRQIQLLEEQKFNIQSANNQKDIKIFELSEQLLCFKNQNQTNKSTPLQNIPFKRQEFVSLLSFIKDTLTMKQKGSDWQEFVQSILDKSVSGEDAGKLINIQEKGRLLSKQIQKLKSHILKGVLKNQQQKLNFMNMMKPCESIIVQIITAAESLSLNQSSFL